MAVEQKNNSRKSKKKSGTGHPFLTAKFGWGLLALASGKLRFTIHSIEVLSLDDVET
jgi:hypothetical protein